MLSTIDKLFARALEKHQAGDFQAAALEYRKILARQKNHADSLHHLGIVHLQLGQIEKAVRFIELSIKVNPLQPNALSNLGYAFNALGRFEAVMRACEQAIALEPSHAGCWANLGNAQKNAGLVVTARSSYHRAYE